MNKDGTYTVYLKIVDAMGTHFELKFSVPSRQIAKDINLKWKNKAENVYALLYENMVNWKRLELRVVFDLLKNIKTVG